jgi:exopolyphosphatase/guanosine-5'-triphosphate,3'-diphosphate pyrophosphatase
LKVASLDLGSNTFLMLIAEVTSAGISKVYRDEIRVTRLGQGVHQSGRLHPEALARAEECFKAYAKILKIEKPDLVVAMATSAARDAANGHELFEIGKKYGIPIQIIPGHLEAEISFDGATYEFTDSRGFAVIDVGGGSTEVVLKTNDGQLRGVSFNVGSVRLTELFVSSHPVPAEDLKKLESYVEEVWRKDAPEINIDQVKKVIAVAGTPTTLAAVVQQKPYSSERVHGYSMDLATLWKWREQLASMGLQNRKDLVGMDPQRADVIVAGLTILAKFTEKLGANALQVSDRGVRFGIALHAVRNRF